MKHNIKGALYGFAIGDALGATTEFMTPEEICKQYSVLRNIVGGGWLNLSEGSVTDDTELMLEVAEAYKESYTRRTPMSVFLDACTVRFLKWFSKNPLSVGAMTARVFIEGREGGSYTDWVKTSKKVQAVFGRSARGNGALTRALYPLLLGDTKAAVAQGNLTHASFHSEQCIKAYGELLSEGTTPLNAVEATKTTTSGDVYDAIAYAQKVLDQGYSFEEALIEIVNGGGDTDSIAAIVGSILGYRRGFYTIPGRWVKALDKRVAERINRLLEK